MGNIFPWKVAVMLESYGISSYVSLSLFLFPLLVSEGDNNIYIQIVWDQGFIHMEKA